MEAILLGIYAFFVWLVFIKFKWLPWNITSQVIVVIIPIVGLTVLILTLNVVAPSSADVRVIKYVVNVVPQVRGRVIEVPVEPNQLVRKGDVLFRIDPTPYELAVRSLEARLADAEASSRELTQQLASARAGVEAARSSVQQSEARVRELQPQIDLLTRRVAQNRELVATGVGDKFALEKAEADLAEIRAKLDTARSAVAQARAVEAQSLAAERQVRERLSGQVNGEYAPVAQIRAELENARWELAQTTVVAPSDGYAINVQLRPGSFTAAFPITPAMTFVEETYQLVALYAQNELWLVEPGQEVEFTLNTHPGRVLKAKVDSIVWAQGQQGQVPMSTQLPNTGVGPIPPGRFPVKLTVDERHADMFFAAGAVGQGAIYTDSVLPIHIIRKVILRVGSKLDVLVLKLH